MMGNRYGEVVGVRKDGAVRVRLDKRCRCKMVVILKAENILEKV